MSKSSVLGIIFGWGIVFATIRIATSDIGMFWDTGSFLLVIIGPYFSMLMGDEVEPRKNYIMENAHFVRNLDIV